MSKCRNEVFMSKIGVEKLNKQVEVHFDVQRDLPDCKRINASKYVSTDADTPRYNQWKTPSNQFECMRYGCVNSGTLFNDGKATVYKIDEEATDYTAGVITFYALAPNGGTATVKISNVADFTDAWEYTLNLDDMSKGKDEFYAVVVDLTKEPTIIGNGFEADGAFYVSIEITPSEEGIGISSIAIFDDIADFEISTQVILGCVTGIDGSWDLDAAEDSCFSSYRGAGYNTDDLAGFERTITAKAITPNYMLLNPLMRKGEATQGFDIATVEKTVQELADTDYGYITLADMAQDECGFFSASLADKCNITDSQLERLSIPSRIDLDEKHYQLIDNGDGGTTVLVNKEHVGAPVLISYPRTADVEEWVFDEESVGEVRVRMSYTKTYSDGVKYRFVFNNVLITSFPAAITQDEVEFSFTISIRNDSKGHFGYAYRILA